MFSAEIREGEILGDIGVVKIMILLFCHKIEESGIIKITYLTNKRATIFLFHYIFLCFEFAYGLGGGHNLHYA